MLKCTHAQKKNTYVKKKKKEKEKQYHPPSPRKKTTPTTPQTEVPMATAKEEPSTVAAKTSTSEVVGILDFLHFYVSAT